MMVYAIHALWDYAGTLNWGITYNNHPVYKAWDDNVNDLWTRVKQHHCTLSEDKAGEMWDYFPDREDELSVVIDASVTNDEDDLGRLLRRYLTGEWKEPTKICAHKAYMQRLRRIIPSRFRTDMNALEKFWGFIDTLRMNK